MAANHQRATRLLQPVSTSEGAHQMQPSPTQLALSRTHFGCNQLPSSLSQSVLAQEWEEQSLKHQKINEHDWHDLQAVTACPAHQTLSANKRSMPNPNFNLQPELCINYQQHAAQFA